MKRTRTRTTAAAARPRLCPATPPPCLLVAAAAAGNSRTQLLGCNSGRGALLWGVPVVILPKPHTPALIGRGVSLSKKGNPPFGKRKSGGGLPIGVCEDMCLANTPYRRKPAETHVFPPVFKSRGGTGGDRWEPKMLCIFRRTSVSRRDPASPSSSLSTLSTS